jgi:hypothetical protein
VLFHSLLYLAQHIFKTATLSTSLQCPSFLYLQRNQPIVKVAVEVKDVKNISVLEEGLLFRMHYIVFFFFIFICVFFLS